MQAMTPRIGWIAAAMMLFIVAAVGTSAGLSAQSETTDVTGKWLLEVKTQIGGTTTPTVVVKQEGEKITGRYSSEALGEADVTGTVKGNAITFSFNASLQGTNIAVTYTGTLEAGRMKGKISLVGLAEGDFYGRKEAP